MVYVSTDEDFQARFLLNQI